VIYPKHIPQIIKPFGKHLCFDIPNENNQIYLTFDDGPHPEITLWTLDLLEKFEAKATFFLIGENAIRYPEILVRIKNEGHAIGNHTMKHISGWKTSNRDYLDQVHDCNSLIKSDLFRPPYGQITHSQSVELKDDYKIIMWSDLSADFDPKVSVDECFHHATHKVKTGSIIVFHDSEKAWPRLEKALPRCLEYYKGQSFNMSPIGF
jgi:peptidoglycan/xylan/chitin deacetylase (PgdA/CDA1 family)